MPTESTIGRLLLENAVPEDVRHALGPLNKKGITKLVEALAAKGPDEYRRTMKRLTEVATRAGYEGGGYSFGPEDMLPGPKAQAMRAEFAQKVMQAKADRSHTPAMRDATLSRLAMEYSGKLQDTIYDEHLAAKNPLAMQVESGAKGKADNLKALVAGDTMYLDQNYNAIPVPAIHSFAEGLRPAEYFGCLTGSTLVRMADGTAKPIQALEIGDFVLGADSTGRTFPTRVVRTYANGRRDCSRYRFRFGRTQEYVELEATADHKILATPGVRDSRQEPARQVRVGDVFLNGYRPLPSGPRVDDAGVVDPRACMLGLMLGDGYIPEDGSTIFTCADSSLVEYIQNYVPTIGLGIRLRHNINYIIGHPSGRRGAVNPLKLWLREWSLLGCRSWEKRIPAVVATWNRSTVASLLAGLMATDGSVKRTRYGTPIISYGSTSRDLLDGFVRLCRDVLGVRFGCVDCQPPSKWRKRPYYSVATGDINAVKRFHSFVDIPGVRGVLLSKLLAEKEEKYQTSCAFYPISRESMGTLETYDIEVEHPEHLYVLANGFIVSNSTFGARLAIGITKLGTAQGGYLSKRLGNLAHRLVVVDKDGPPRDPNEAPTGLPVDTHDPDNENGFLAHAAGGYERNTHLTGDVLANLRKQGIDRILVRSPIVGGPPDGGVYGLDVGVRERGMVAPKGDHVGRAAADSLSEPLTQMLISSKHCLKNDTMIRMADWSVKRIDQVQVGDWVLGSDMVGNTAPTEVVNVYDNGLRECYRVPFSFGKRDEVFHVDATLDHKILGMTLMSSCKEEVENNILRMLPLGKTAARFFAMAPISFTPRPGLVREPRAFLIGLLLGDGCYVESMGNHVYLSCADDTLVEETREYLATLNLKLMRCQASNGIQWRFSRIDQTAIVRDAAGNPAFGKRNPASQLLEEFGMWGKYSYEKTIPEAAFGWDNTSVSALLGGLMVTDGSIFKGKISKYPFAKFNSTSSTLVEQFRALVAWRFGIFFGPVNGSNSGRDRPLYGSELARYNDVRRLRDVVTLYGVKRKTYDDLLAVSDAALATTPKNGYEKVMAPYRLKRRKWESIGVHPTFDIEVSATSHLFVLANGLIVSNSGGVAGATGGQQGFPVLERMFSVPSTYPGGVTHAQRDGMVTMVREAPQGGNYVHVDGEEHYVPVGHKVMVQAGDKIEAGDDLSDGVRNPRDLVHHKGIGEGRRAFVTEFMRVAKNNGFKADRRNVELIARGFIDHVRLDQEHGEYAPGEVASYTAIAHDYQPRPGHVRGAPTDLVGQHLERPALHYSIGTRITPKVAAYMGAHGVGQVVAHPDPPPFTPVLIRSNDTLSYDRDPLTQMLGSGLEGNLLESVARGAVADPAGTSYVPALAEGVNFGSPKFKSTGWRIDPNVLK